MLDSEAKNPSERLPASLVSEGSNEPQNLTKRLDRYGKARDLAVSMIVHFNGLDYSGMHPIQVETLKKMRVRLVDCGNYLKFRDYYTVGDLRLVGASFCKQHLICPLCAIRRGSKSLASYLDRYQVIQKENPGIRASLVTLTVKNGPDLLERFSHLQAGIKTLNQRRRDYLAKGRGSSEFIKILGAVGSYEITNKGNGWHPHCHLIALHYGDLDAFKLSAEWKEITGDSFIIDITEFSQEKEPVENFMEVFKYAVKFSDLSKADNLEAALLLKSKRLIFSFGLFRGVKVPESLVDEPLDDLPYIEYFYRYYKGKGYVQQ